MRGAYLTGAIVVTAAFFGTMEMTAEQFLKNTGIAVCLMISYSAVYHMISLLSGSKVRAAVLCILVGFGFFIFIDLYFFRIGTAGNDPAVCADIREKHNRMGEKSRICGWNKAKDI